MKIYSENKNKSEGSAEKQLLTSGALKSVAVILLSLCLLVLGTFAWFGAYKIPNTADLTIDDPYATLRIDKFDQEAGRYNLFYDEPYGGEEAEVALDIPEMTFYKWEGSVVSSVVEKLYYRITVTSRFNPEHFSKDPLFYMVPHFTAEASQTLLENIKIIRAEYLLFDPVLGEPPTDSFPLDDYLRMPLENDLEDALTFPEVRKVTVGGEERFQSVVYLILDSDTEAVAEIIDRLSYSMEAHTAANSLTLSFGFRSVPFYVPSVSSE